MRFFRTLAVLLSLGALPALAAQPSPFAPPAAEKPKRVRILAFADYFDLQTLAEFERASGFQIAYDSYEAPDAIPAKLRDGPYDLLVLPGPELARQITLGALQKFDKAKAPNSAKLASAPAAKLAAYDRTGAFALAYAWAAAGVIYDADAVPARLGGPPASWAVLFAPEQARKLFDCGIAAPDSRDDLFVAAMRYIGIDPAKAAAPDIKRAADLIARAKMSFRVLSATDLAGALAKGSACIGMGGQSAAQLAMARAATGAQKRDIRFVLPKEGGPMSLDALAIPADAPNVAQAYALADFLLRSDIAARNAKAAGAVSSQANGNDEVLKRLWPTGALAPAAAALAEKEWARLNAAK